MHKLAIILVALLVPALARATPIETYHLAEDGTDYQPAFERAQVACPAGTPCDIELTQRAYEIHRPVEICTTVHLIGRGMGAANEGTAIYVKGRHTAFRSWPAGKCPLPELGAFNGRINGAHLTIANLNALPVNAPGDPAEAPFFGIDTKQTLYLTDVSVSGFVQGVRLVCDVQYDKSNCSGAYLQNVAVVLSEHAGFYFQGGDSNASTVIGGRSDTNCRNATRWNSMYIASLCGKLPNHAVCTTQHFQCAGYMDLSFLGNTFIGTITHAENGYAGYVIAGANQGTVGLGLYAENDTLPQFVDSRSNIVGGLNSFEGPGGQWHGITMPGLTVGYGSWVALGTASHGADAFMASGNARTGPHSWRWKLDPNTGDLFIDVGNLHPRRWSLPFTLGGTYSAWTLATIFVIALVVGLVVVLFIVKRHRQGKSLP